MRKSSKPAGAERGVALIVAMIVLVIIGLTSVSVMRGAFSSDQLINNSRVQTLAAQAAQIALRYCEAKANDPNLDPNKFHLGASASQNDLNWLTYANWSSGNNIVNDVPDEYMATAESTFVATTAPQCIAQCTVLADGKRVLQTNSRGFSPDYSEDDSTGSVVWLQSTVYPANNCP